MSPQQSLCEMAGLRFFAGTVIVYAPISGGDECGLKENFVMPRRIACTR